MNVNKLLRALPGFSMRHKTVAACLLLSALALPAIADPNVSDNTAAHAPKKGYSLIHSFSGSDGQNVWSQVIKGKDGYLYGTANGGGSHTNGVIYKIAPDGTESTLYNFAGGNDGSVPASLPRLFADKNGNLYGTTIYGGGSGCSSGSGCGTVFELTAGGTETVLHSFNSATDGAAPFGGVIMDKKGSLYGTTSSSGPDGDGTVYKLAANGTFTVLHSFGGSDGNTPFDGLLMDKAGNLYGTTLYGGSSNDGVVFKISSDGKYTILHSFTGGSDGAYPQCALIMDASGNLYGTTGGGGVNFNGTIFEIAKSGAETVLYSFAEANGTIPTTLSMDSSGNLYGTTGAGGAYNYGTVFEFSTNGTLTTLLSFPWGSGGFDPVDGVTINKSGSKIIGTTSGGGGTGCGGGGCGIVYQIKQ